MNERNQDPLDDLIQKAYPSKEADPALAEKLASVAENHARSPRKMTPRARLGRLPLVAAGVLMAVAALAAFQYFFGRTGEAAIALIPSDAGVVVSLDTNPSENQLAVYQKLGAALHREGLDSSLADLIKDGVGESPLEKKIRPQLTLNFAVGIWPAAQAGGQERTVGLVAVKDPAAVSRALQEEGKPVPVNGISMYSYRDNHVIFGVVGNYLLLTSDPEMAARVARVRSGAEPSISDVDAYREARSSLPSDANLMLFVSPAAIRRGSDQFGAGAVPSPKWLSVGAALREGGIRFDWRSPVDSQNMSRLMGAHPIDMGIMRKLPDGAYGLMAWSNLAGVYNSVREGVTKDPKTRSQVDGGLKEFEKSTGLSIEQDILPAFKGDTVLAAYPDANMAKAGIDGVLLVDSANGADPVTLANKVRALIEKKGKEGGGGATFTESTIGDATVWRLDSKSEAAMRKDLGANGEAKASAGGMKLTDKTVLYATVQGSVVIASSPAMLNKTLATFHGGRALADDPGFATMQAMAEPDSSFLTMVALGRILEAFRPNVEEMLGKSSALTADDVINLFGGQNNGIVSSGRLEGDVVKGSCFVPLDYDRFAKVVHDITKGHKRPEMDSSDPEVLK